jgi:hypothetical protein
LWREIFSRLLNKAHLLRYPAASPSRWRGKKSLLTRRDATLRVSRALHLGIFEQPEENSFFSKLFDSTYHPSTGSGRTGFTELNSIVSNSDSSGFCVDIIPPLVTLLYSPLSLRGDEGGLGEL